jgi:zinc transport system substrate-binding protein
MTAAPLPGGRTGPPSERRRTRWRGSAATVAVVAAAVSSACGPTPSGSPGSAPPLEVATAAYPVAQVVDLIGEGKAHAVDLVAPGSDPFAFEPGPGQENEVQRAGLLVLAGQGAQPGSYSLASAAKLKLDLGASASEPYFWLDPHAMREAVPVVEAAMERADPAHAGSFKAGARALEVELDSTAIDYESTLSTCPRRTVFAADDAFASVASRYDLDYTALGASPPNDTAKVTAESAAVRAAGATTVFSETWVSAPTVDAVAASAGVKVRTLDTLLGPPPGGWPRQVTYINLLESNLGRLNDALGCAGSSTQ